ncbi:MAG: hypothetical protein A3J38_03905 [Gammaproteobacteria bacterium RIFCSPHIGHO2_12_FULL_45_9]|nr:MAG: hypothetical protein A3J38_03905 [Gammaproteobacteria bacterium RIFCSPHIGHO2_12_FULL_45_9]
MRILVITFYFFPDLGASSFRMREFVKTLAARLPADSRVDVLTTMPHRYASQQQPMVLPLEVDGNLTIERVPLLPHGTGMVSQVYAFIQFYRAVLKRVRNRQYDLVFATSSRLMTAFIGAKIARRLNVPLYLDIRDIFIDTLKDVLSGLKVRVLLPILSRIERYVMQEARRVNLVSAGFLPYFEARYGRRNIPYDFFTNGIDTEFLSVDWVTNNRALKRPIRVLYAGNVGDGQGLHKILPGLAKAAGPLYHFVVVGDGARRTQLMRELKRCHVTHVTFMLPMTRSELCQCYQEADILFLHLNDCPAFTKVLPSKIFEYAATGKPILAGVSGFAASFLGQVENCAIFDPCDSAMGLAALHRLTLTYTERTAFIQQFSRDAIMEKMIASVMAVAG